MSKSKKCFNMESSTFYFHMKANILADFQTCISVPLSNEKYMIQPTFINLHPNEYSQEFHYYPFSVKLDRCTHKLGTSKIDCGDNI